MKTKEEIIEEFEDRFVADDVLDCIPEKNWEEMKGEVASFIFDRILKHKQEIVEETKDWEKEFDKLEIDDGGRGLHIPLRLDSEQETTIKNFIIKLLNLTP